MAEARDAEVTQALEQLQEGLAGSAVCLLTRSGGLFAGAAPPQVNRETFAAMMAVMHGASEAGTAELGEGLMAVEVRLNPGAVVVVGAGRKMLLVAHLKEASSVEAARPKLEAAALRLGALF